MAAPAVYAAGLTEFPPRAGTLTRHYPDLLSQLNDPPKRSDGIVETCRENGCFKKLEEILKAMGSP
jgi:hypothetical protein